MRDLTEAPRHAMLPRRSGTCRGLTHNGIRASPDTHADVSGILFTPCRMGLTLPKGDAAMYEEIIYQVEDPVATITINRPERLNALTARAQVEIHHAMIAAEHDERVVGIILTETGR